jgi:hypothetical protein
MTISELIDNISEGQEAKATFVNDSWYVYKDRGFIRYYDHDNWKIGETIKLTYSNLRADYELL